MLRELKTPRYIEEISKVFDKNTKPLSKREIHYLIGEGFFYQKVEQTVNEMGCVTRKGQNAEGEVVYVRIDPGLGTCLGCELLGKCPI